MQKFVSSNRMLCAALILLVACADAQLHYQPEQIHLAFGEKTNDITVTWSTFTDTKNSIVEYSLDKENIFTHRQVGTSKTFVDGGELQLFQFIHKVSLTNLEYNSTYVYHCGSDEGWSEVFWFKTPPRNEDWQPYLAVYGDLGNINARSLPRLQNETQAGMYDAIFHLGDFAYDMDTNNGLMGDEFMRQIQPIAAYLPYMTCAGNHESAYNFSHYKARFNMPGNFESHTYSIDIGPMHVIFLSTEVYYYLNYGKAPVLNQYQWLEQDLIKANLPESRAKQPWIIVAGHRPMYCSDDDGDDCAKNSTKTRVGVPKEGIVGMEQLFYRYGVDVEIWAHEHSYERLWPVYDSKIYNGSLEEPYTNPKAPVHIISGSAGCQENTDPFIKHPLEWSAFRSSDYGYARLKAYNSSHIYFEQLSIDKNEIIDKLWIIKDTHGPYTDLS